MLPLLQNKKTDTLGTVGGINTSAITATLTTGNFGSPSYKIVALFDPANATYPNRWEFIRFTVAGSSITQMERNFGSLNPSGAQVHDQGCEIRLVTPAEYLNTLITQAETGWTAVPDYLATAFVATSTSDPVGNKFSIEGDWTSVLAVGDKIRLTNSTVKYFHVIDKTFGSGVTTITVNLNTDYVLAAGALSAVSFSKAVNPSGFPRRFNWTPTISTGGGLTFSSVVVNRAVYVIDNKFSYEIQVSGTVGGTLTGYITSSFPVPAAVGSNSAGIFNGYDENNTKGMHGYRESTTVMRLYHNDVSNYPSGTGGFHGAGSFLMS